MLLNRSIPLVNSVIVLLMVTAHADGQTSNQATACRQLTSAIQTLCGLTAITQLPTSTQQCNCSRSVSWTSVPKITIGTNNLQHAATYAFDIPSVIPSSAVEVLVHAYIFSGIANRGPYQDIKIYTQKQTNRFEQYLTIYG